MYRIHLRARIIHNTSIHCISYVCVLNIWICLSHQQIYLYLLFPSVFTCLFITVLEDCEGKKKWLRISGHIFIWRRRLSLSSTPLLRPVFAEKRLINLCKNVSSRNGQKVAFSIRIPIGNRLYRINVHWQYCAEKRALTNTRNITAANYVQ